MHSVASDASMELIYGKKPILEILTHRPELICKLYVSGKTTELEAIPALNDIPSEQVTATELDQLTKGGVHQGIVAELVGRNEGSISSLIEQSSSSGSGVIIVLDEVVDPHNLGAIYRVADAAGVDGVVVTTKRSSPVTAVVRKVSMGATELVPTVFATNLQRTLRELKKCGSINLVRPLITLNLMAVVPAANAHQRHVERHLSSSRLRLSLVRHRLRELVLNPPAETPSRDNAPEVG